MGWVGIADGGEDDGWGGLTDVCVRAGQHPDADSGRRPCRR